VCGIAKELGALASHRALCPSGNNRTTEFTKQSSFGLFNRNSIEDATELYTVKCFLSFECLRSLLMSSVQKYFAKNNEEPLCLGLLNWNTLKL